MKLSITLASLVYLAPTLIQAYSLSHEDGTLDVRDAPRALHHQFPRQHDAKPVEGLPEESLPHLIHEKERRDAEFAHESPHEVSNAHAEELMIERDDFLTENTEANTYPHYQHYGEHNKLHHKLHPGGHHKLHHGNQHWLHPDEKFQRSTLFEEGEKDPSEAKDLDFTVSHQHGSEEEGKVTVKLDHEEQDIKDTSHHAHAEKGHHIKMSHHDGTRPHQAKAIYFVHGEKDHSKPHNPKFHANLHKVAAVQGKISVKPEEQLAKPVGAAEEHHYEAREAHEANPDPAHLIHQTHSHKHSVVHHAHRHNAVHFVHGKKHPAKHHNPDFYSKLRKVAGVQGKVPVKPAGPVVKLNGAILKHHGQAHAHNILPVQHSHTGAGNKAAHKQAAHGASNHTHPRIKEHAHEAVQGSGTSSGDSHVASASDVQFSELETELLVGPNGMKEDSLEPDITMPAADVGELDPLMPPSMAAGTNQHKAPGDISPSVDEAGDKPNIPQHHQAIGQSGAPGWLSELVAEDRDAVKNADPGIPLPTGSLQQQLAAFNELEATAARDSPLVTNTHLAEQLSENNGLMYDGKVSAPPPKKGQSDPSVENAKPNADPPNGGAVPTKEESTPSAENADPEADAVSGGVIPAQGAKNQTNNAAPKAAKNPQADAAPGDISQDQAAAAKAVLPDQKKVPEEIMKRNLWEILGVSDDV
ncbi:hypothetical protein MMC18_008801 [Xylographa bjoerkii]|nr:hypothetical protein [Xylographa bjoerkii]